MVPFLRTVDQQGVTAADLRRMVAEFTALEGSRSDATPLTEQDRLTLMTTAGALAVYPRARQYLAAQGRSPAELDQMSVPEVLVRYIRDQYEIQRDNFFKWFSLPYAQAAPGMARADTELVQAIERDPIGNVLAKLLLPALGRASLRFAELNRKFAALRCLEAIRMQAAARPGALPATLDETPVPCPEDPLTGQPFTYRREGDTGFLEAPLLPGQRQAKSLSYQINLRK